MPRFEAQTKQQEMELIQEEEIRVTEEDVKKTLPQIQGVTIPENCIYLPEEGTESGVLISSMDVKEPEKATDQKLIFSG